MAEPTSRREISIMTTIRTSLISFFLIGILLGTFGGCDSDDVTYISLPNPTVTYRLTGRVLDHAYGLPLAGASYAILGSDHSGTCDDLGVFQVDDLTEGTYQIILSSPGYATVRTNIHLSAAVKRIEAVVDFQLVTTSGSVVLKVYGEPDGVPLQGVTISVSDVRMSAYGNTYEFDPASYTASGVTDSTGSVTLTGIPNALVTFSAAPHDIDDDGVMDYGNADIDFDLREFVAPPDPIMMPLLGATEPILMQSNIPNNGYSLVGSSNVWILFSHEIDPATVFVEITLEQDNPPYEPIPVTAEWTSPIRLQCSPVVELNNDAMDYELVITITSDDGWIYLLSRRFYWITGSLNLDGDCDETVTELTLDPIQPPFDYDTRSFSLSWPAVTCSSGYNLYARDDRNNQDWVLLLTDSTDYEWGVVETTCLLPEFFDRYQVDGLLTPLAGINVSFCIVPVDATNPAPGSPHAVLQVADGTAPSIQRVEVTGGAFNDTSEMTPLQISLLFSEFVAVDSPDPILFIAELGGDPGFALDPMEATWSWDNGRHSGTFLFMIPPGVDASGDEVTMMLDNLIDLSGNSTGTLATEAITLSAYNGVFDFEFGSQGWTTVGDGWEQGVPSNGPQTGFNSMQCWGVALSGTYGNSWNGSLFSPEVLVCGDTPSLSFYCWYSLYSYGDYVLLRVIDEDGRVHELDSFTSSYENWMQRSYPLLSFVGQRIQVQFQFTSDSSLARSGFFLDDVHIGCE